MVPLSLWDTLTNNCKIRYPLKAQREALVSIYHQKPQVQFGTGLPWLHCDLCPGHSRSKQDLWTAPQHGAGHRCVVLLQNVQNVHVTNDRSKLAEPNGG